MKQAKLLSCWLILPALLLGGCADNGHPAEDLNTRPSWLGNVSAATYDGTTDDLLTAGLGKSGLASATAPTTSATPTSAELRRLAIYANYRAIVDVSANGGYGRLFGPNIDLAGNDTLGEGMIAGAEYIAYADDGSGLDNVTLLVQVPKSFDPKNPCIVTATSSGSRGVYGAIGASGEWGLKRGCAVAYADKGSGNGAYQIDTDAVTLIDGTLANGLTAGTSAHFRPAITDAQRQAYSTTAPFRYAFKHAHSQRNPEKDWGLHTLRSIEFAFWQLNELYGGMAQYTSNAHLRAIKPENTIVIAAGVSNGAGAALAAAEQDTQGLIDGVVVGEPQITVNWPAGLVVRRGGVPVAKFGLPLYDYMSLANLLQPCAAIAPSNAASPLLATISQTAAAARCASLVNAGVITGATAVEQAENAKSALHDYGYEAETDLLQASHWGLQATTAVVATYANAYSRSSVLDNLCGYSFATTSALGVPAAPAANPMLKIFGLGNGVPPTGGINLIQNNAANGPIVHTGAISASSGTADYDFDGANCLRQLYTGTTATSDALRTGVNETKRTANLQGKPAIILQGRSDTLVPVNHASRPYLGANKMVEGAKSELSYIEVMNANHFDAFLGLAGYDTRLIPLGYYKIQALNMMWAHLTSGAALPASQVVRTTPRGGTPGAAPALTLANLPPIATTPAVGDAINVVGSVVDVPN